LGLIVTFVAVSSHAYEKLSWQSKDLLAGKASLTSDGFSLSRTFGTANFSPEFRMPVQLIYNSSNDKRGLFGDAWSSPQLESRMFPRKDGAEWSTPWGEKVSFFFKQKTTKETLDLYKKKMKGKGLFSPYADWEAKGSRGNWLIAGQNKKKGWVFEYNKSYLKRISAPSGRKLTFEYKGKKLLRIKQNGKAFVELEYDKETRLVGAMKVSGAAFTFAYADASAIVLPEKTSQRGTDVERTMLTQIAFASYAPENFSYDSYGYLSGIKRGDYSEKLEVEHESVDERLAFLKKKAKLEKAGKSTKRLVPEKISGRILKDKFLEYTYPAKETVSIQNVEGQIATYNYSGLKGVLKVKNFAGLEQQIFYFRRFDVAYNGKFRQIRDAKDRVVVNCRYDKKTGELIRRRDMADNETYFKYDKKRNLILVSRTEDNPLNPIRPLAAFKYDKANNPILIEKLDRNGKPVYETKLSYDKRNDVAKVETPERCVKINYNDFGLPVRITDVFGRLYVRKYDEFNRLKQTVSPQGVCTVYKYGKATQLVYVDIFETKKKQKLLSSAMFSYNKLGRMQSVTDNKSRTRKVDRNAKGRIIAEYAPDSSVVKYSYNQLGQLAQVCDQNGNPISFVYNEFGKIEERTTAVGQLMQNTYDKFGMLKVVEKMMYDQVFDAAQRIEYKYDEFDRATAIDYGNGQVKNFKYDSYGKVLEMEAVETKDGKKTVRRVWFAYDQFDKVSGKKIVLVDSDGTVKEQISYEYTYMPSGKVASTKIVFPDGGKKLTKRAYDKYGRLSEINDNDRRVTYKYDDKSRLVEKSLNGVPVHFTYTKLGQLESKILGGKKTPIASVKYFYAPDGQITGRAVNGKLQNYEYDLKGQLTGVKGGAGNYVEKYVYDPAGNILSKTINGKTTTYTYDQANQLATANLPDSTQNIFRYDAAGRLKSEETNSTTKEYTYGWLDKVMKVNNIGTANSSVEFAYHPDGQLASRNATDGAEHFFWDGLALIKRNQTNYTVEPAITGGNPVLADDEALFNDMLGTTLGSYNGKEFIGNHRTAFGGGTEKGFFTGKPYVKELGAVFLFRNYKPETGKWMTSDPLGYPDGWNNFAYCNNWVITCLDRLGTDIYHVNASGAVSGVGHSGAIVGSPEFGYHIMNHGGGNTDPDVINSWSNKYDSVSDALSALKNGRTGEDAFDRIQKFDTTPGQDDIAYGAMLDSAAEGFDELTNNCWDVIEDGLDAGNVDRVIGSFTPNQAFNLNAGQCSEILNFDDVVNGIAE